VTDRESVDDRLAETLRDERSRLAGALVRVIGDWDLAEELVQEAAVAALEHWPRDGMPDNPAAWLMTTARRRAVDLLRRRARYRERMELLTREAVNVARRPETGGPMQMDERLPLLFTCCHPALRREAQIALTLRIVGGLETAAIARAFLVSETTIAQRLVRAKRKIRDARIPYRVPGQAELPARLSEVLRVLYLVFNEGYLASSGTSAERRGLARDAEWLTSLLVRLMPDEPEAIGLLALMRLHVARADARFDAGGDIVLLRDQDRARWDRAAINEAVEILRRAERARRPGPYQLQAAILASHALAPSWEATAWDRVAILYDQLVRLEPTPVVMLNRAVVVAERDGPAAGLAAIEELAEPLRRYHLFHATRGEFLRRLGRQTEAAAANRLALELTDNPAERRLLTERLR
jgi:RNA polymerase sigma factor (sigma-70 family)